MNRVKKSLLFTLLTNSCHEEALRSLPTTLQTLSIPLHLPSLKHVLLTDPSNRWDGGHWKVTWCPTKKGGFCLLVADPFVARMDGRGFPHWTPEEQSICFLLKRYRRSHFHVLLVVFLLYWTFISVLETLNNCHRTAPGKVYENR